MKSHPTFYFFIFLIASIVFFGCVDISEPDDEQFIVPLEDLVVLSTSSTGAKYNLYFLDYNDPESYKKIDFPDGVDVNPTFAKFSHDKSLLLVGSLFEHLEVEGGSTYQVNQIGLYDIVNETFEWLINQNTGETLEGLLVVWANDNSGFYYTKDENTTPGNAYYDLEFHTIEDISYTVLYQFNNDNLLTMGTSSENDTSNSFLKVSDKFGNYLDDFNDQFINVNNEQSYLRHMQNFFDISTSTDILVYFGFDLNFEVGRIVVTDLGGSFMKSYGTTSFTTLGTYKSVRNLHPEIGPDGKHFLYSTFGGSEIIVKVNIETHSQKVFVEEIDGNTRRIRLLDY